MKIDNNNNKLPMLELPYVRSTKASEKKGNNDFFENEYN